MAPTLQVNKSSITRVSMLLWGTAGCGKTHFANTAPGKRVFLNFDPDGTASLPLSDDTLLLDYAWESDRMVDEVQKANPFGLDTLLKENEDIRTVVVDSVTAFVTKAVAHAIGTTKGASFNNPTIAGYGLRNRLTLELAKSLLQVTARHSRNIIFICHEENDRNDEGQVTLTTVMLGGQLKEQVPLQISEVWHLQDNMRERIVHVRSSPRMKPMKTRMFDTTAGYEFIASNTTHPSKVTLAALFDRWREAKYDKIKLP